ncbi:MAG TPA: FAD-dependent oxidoreductase [Dehalococcoidales bacterium]|nr:FAD-dependent oxidoreductase [Dehalococcoidales bacterium]
MNPARIKNVEILKTDVVVVGGGAAGLTAAVAAAEKGAAVVLLEKGSTLGGNAAIYGKEIPAVESPVQKRELIDVTRDALFRKAMKNCRWDCDPRVVRAFIDKSGDTMRWLEEKGIKFRMIRIHPDEEMVVFHKVIGDSELGGQKIVNVLTKSCRDLGVKLFCEAATRRILTGTKGEVTGVVVEMKDGKEGTIAAKSVIIATGGYPANKKLVAKYRHYHPDFASAGLPYEGDGIALATAIGAATEGLGALALCGPNPERKVLSLTIGGRTHELSLMVVAQEPYTLWVNKKGKRFVDESIGYNHYAAAIPLARQPEGLSYTIFDSGILRMMSEKGFIIGLAPRIEDWWAQRDGNLAGLESELRRLADEGVVMISDSWDEIARWTGAPPEAVKATVEEYNEVCENGYDPIFVKERRYLLPLRTPPYYAIRCKGSILHTMGGIKINEHMEALDKEAEPIAGLYAAGMETGGWENVHLDWLVGGMTVALNGGRIAGENAAGHSS